MPKVMILNEHGSNCEFESKHAFELAGRSTGIDVAVDIVHMEELIRRPKVLSEYQTLMLPGGFSYGDDTGSANAWANRIRANMWDEMLAFVDGDHLVLGICNGFQALVNLGLLPGTNGDGQRQTALVPNESARYIDRWVDLKFYGRSHWLRDIGQISLPIAHGEGKFYAPPETLAEIKQRGLVAARYVEGEIYQLESRPADPEGRVRTPPANPTGTLDDIAAVTDPSGRILGMMPHPERAVRFTQHPHWTSKREEYRKSGRDMPRDGPGLRIFENALKYFDGGCE